MPMLARLASFVAAAGTLDSSLAVRPAKDFDLSAGSVDTAVVAEVERTDLDIPVPSSFILPDRDSIFILKEGALASEAQQLDFPLGGVTSKQVVVHLTEDTAQGCDYGITFTETDCETVGTAILEELKMMPGRTGLIISQADDAPPGCSFMTGMDWAVTYNTNKDGKNSANKYSILCHGDKKAVHAVKEGKSECDFGKSITKVTDCLDSVNKVHNTLMGDANGKEHDSMKINVGKWSMIPPGCSLHLGSTGINLHLGASDVGTHAADQVAWFNNDPDGKNDGTYLEICSGTPVP